MENRNIIIALGIIVVILAIVASLFVFNINPLNQYKDVDADYVYAPIGGEKVRFTGTYLGPDEGLYNFDRNRGVIQVGNSYAIINTDKVQGLEGQTVTVEGYFVNDKTDSTTVPIKDKYVTGENFCLENVVDASD